MSSETKPIVHRGVALMLCENEAILEETLLNMDVSNMHVDRISDRAIVAPAYELEKIRDALREKGTFPKVIGRIVRPEDLEPDEDQQEAEGDEQEASDEEADDESADGQDEDDGAQAEEES